MKGIKKYFIMRIVTHDLGTGFGGKKDTGGCLDWRSGQVELFIFV